MHRAKVLGTGALLAVVTLFAFSARADSGPPPELAAVDVVEHLGSQVPPDLEFADARGKRVRLGDYFQRGRPIVLTLAYFDCPMLCSLVLEGTVRGVLAAGSAPGRDLDLLTVSFNPDDKPAEAAEKRRHYLQALGLGDRGPDWPFLTGGEEAIRALARSLGFVYAKVPHTSQFAHAAVVFVLTPKGAIARYLYGTEASARDLRLALAEARDERAAPSFDRFLLRCYRYDPATRRYGLYLKGFFRVGGVLILGALSIVLFRLWRIDLRRAKVT